MNKINPKFLKEINSYYQQQGFYFKIKGLNYERCAELPFILEYLHNNFNKNFKHLDIGTGGESPLPIYLLKNTNWKILCVDKFEWVQKQNYYLKKIAGKDYEKYKERFNVIISDILSLDLPENSFDVITHISVIEHLEGNSDTEFMIKTSKLLKKDGIYIFTTLINDKFFKEYYLEKEIYGKSNTKKKYFYQRHYDVTSMYERLINPTKLKIEKIIYFGDYDVDFFSKYLHLPKYLKPLKIFYGFLNPFFARKFITYREYPISRKDMTMNTSSGAIVIMRK